MCGIVGYLGNKKACPILMKGLSRLEYRGYDSAGLSTIEEEKLSCIKNKGRVNDLEDLLKNNILNGTIGIAHTRWATHGKPSAINSHPHLDNSKIFSVVHNGIIENYKEIKEFLIEKGYNFISETDTEVIPNLIHYYFTDEKIEGELKFLNSVKKACNDLKGSYALEIISYLYPDKMIVTRRNSPLVIGKGIEENYVSSDIPAILSFTKDFYLMNDNEYAVITRDKVLFYDDKLNKIEKEIKNIEWDATLAEKDGYEDYMLKEIYEQPKSIRETIGARIKMNSRCEIDELDFTKEYLLNLNKIYIVACGTAMNAGLATKKLIEELCNIPVEVDIASEFRYRNPIVNSKTLMICISQSGETADTIAALKLAKDKGAKTIAISNVIGSSITREADYTLYTHAGPEIAVASTKAYTSQIVLLSILGIYLAEILESANLEKINSIKQEILDLPSKVEKTLSISEEIKNISKKVAFEKDMFFIGRGVDYAVAVEGSLKLKEISYIHSEGYASGELKHGPIALIEDGVSVISIITNEDLMEKSISNVKEVETRGAKVLLITNQKVEDTSMQWILKIPEVNYLISPVISVIPLQLFAYYIAKEKKLDVDKPRNLAKSVTVE